MSGSSPPPSGGDPVRRAAFATRELDVASAVITRMYADNKFHIGRHDASFELRVVNLTSGPLISNVLSYGAQGRVETNPTDQFTTMTPYAGTMTFTRPGEPDQPVGVGEAWRYDTEKPLAAAFALGSTYGTLTLPLTAIAEVAAESGGTEARTVRFLDNVPAGDVAQRYWVQLMRFAHQQADAPDSPLSNPLIRVHLLRTLAGAALHAFPNTIMTSDYEPGPGDVGPATLRRAVAYLHAHAAEPLTVARIALVAGIGVRALQQAFLRHHGCTPMAYLRRVRLEYAHRELRAADPASGDTVAAVAARWGFAHPSKFAAAYRVRYSTSPSDTLRG